MSPRVRFIAIMAIALMSHACSDTPDELVTDVEVPAASADEISDLISDVLDANHGGHPDFLWLPPIITGGDEPSGPLATGLAPVVEICNKNDACTRNVAQEKGSHYHFDLKTGIEGRPSAGSPFRIRVYGVDDYLLGSFSVALTNNRNIPLRFWIGEGFEADEAQACIDDTRCDLGTVVDDEGGTVRVTNSDSEGSEVIAAAKFPEGWSPGGIDRTVIIDCRNDLPSRVADDGSGPLPSVLTQLPWYCDFSVDPPLDPGQEFNETVIVEVCETVDEGHAEVVLGKSSNPLDFVLLPFVQPTELDDCFTDYPGGGDVVGAASGFWGKASTAVAALFRVVGPEPLRATMLRDGGAGGAVRAFSAINPVIPAEIHVHVVGDGGGLEITLFEGSDVVDVQTTGEGGSVSFPNLVDGVYTVTITGETEVEYEGGPSQEVLVDASGEFEVEFVPEDSENPEAGTITGTIPASGSRGFGQLITIDGEDLPGAELEPTVWFTQGETTLPAQFVWSSSSTRYVVRSPTSGMNLGPVGITIESYAGTTNVQPYEFTYVPAAPVITHPKEAATVVVGSEFLLEAHGIDTWSVQFLVEVVQGENVVDVTGQGVTGGPNGLPANQVTLPYEAGLVEGPAIIRLRVGEGNEGFPYSPPAELNVDLVIPG